MSIETYRGYVIEGLAKPAGDGMYESRGFVWSGYHSGRQSVAESMGLGCYTASQRAQDQAILWARRYVDNLIVRVGQ